MIERRSSRVYGCAGSANTSAASPSSAISPAYITATRSHASATMPRLCVIRSSAVSKFRRRSARMRRIWASTITSSAVVGSSAIRAFGFSTSASAIMMRCRMPPENSCGYCLNRVGGMPIPASVSRARLRISSSSMPGSCVCRTSRKWLSIVTSGSRRVIGSWKMRPSSGPRIDRSSASSSPSRFWPRRTTSPLVAAPSGRRPMIARPSVDLPDPDSPTRPRVSPARISREMPSTARTGRSSVPYQTWRSRTDRTGSALTRSPPRPRAPGPECPACGSGASG